MNLSLSEETSKEREKLFWIRIEDKDNFVFPLKKIIPSSPDYIPHWRQEKKRCIEGFWGKDFNKYRFMPGQLYFYMNYWLIVDTHKKRRIKKKPNIADIYWNWSYGILTSMGFSGFEDDDIHTCVQAVNSSEFNLEDWKEANCYDKSGNFMEDVWYNVISKQTGKIKKYISPIQLLSKLHDIPLGKPLYNNEAGNYFILGSRGSGKSFFIGLAVNLHAICFDGQTSYDEINPQNKDKAKLEVVIGSGSSDKSGELIQKVSDCMNEFGNNPDLSAWGVNPDAPDYQPCPWYKRMEGTTKVGNKKDGGWRHNYKKKIKGEWRDGFGSQATLYHVSYSAQKTTGAESAAGSRASFSTIEEVGLTANVEEVWGSNNGIVTTDGVQFGCQVFLGTGGHIESIQASRKMFTKPKDYNIISYNDIWEDTGEIGMFLPAHMTLFNYKDRNGNTDLDKAINFFKEKRRKVKDNPKLLRMEKMNYPEKPSEMWISSKSAYLPYEEATIREKELRKGDLYKSLMRPVTLVWDSTQPYGVKYEVNPGLEPIISHRDKDKEGCVVLYETPPHNIPNDMFKFVGHDPHIGENPEEGSSFGVTYIIMNPKYITEGYNGNTIVASYIAKPSGGLEEYYLNQEKLLALYGNPTRGLWYEANKGEYVRGYYMRKNKLHLLAPRPQREKGNAMMAKRVPQFGYIVGNKDSKLHLISLVHDWLLEETELSSDGIKRNIERIPCYFLINQIREFDMEKGNWDGVMGLVGAILGLKEEMNAVEEKLNRQTNDNKFRNLIKAGILKNETKSKTRN